MATKKTSGTTKKKTSSTAKKKNTSKRVNNSTKNSNIKKTTKKKSTGNLAIKKTNSSKKPVTKKAEVVGEVNELEKVEVVEEKVSKEKKNKKEKIAKKKVEASKKTTKVKKEKKQKEPKEEKQVVIEDKKKEPVKDKKKDKKKETKKENKSKTKKANKKKEKLTVKFKKLSKPFKILIIVSIFCAFLLFVESILILNHKSFLERNNIYHDTYSSGYLDDDLLAVVGSSDFKHGNFNIRLKDNERGKLTVYNGKGEMVLQKIYKKGITTVFNSVVSVDDGYVVVGTGIFSEEELNKEAQEAFIIKYSKEGKILWEKFYQVLTNTSFSRVIKVKDGYVAVGQSIYANMEMGNHTTGGGIIVKYDNNGNEVWHSNHGGTKSGNFNDIVYVKDAYYVVGKDGTDWGNIVKFNESGEYEWHKNYAYTDEIGFTNIVYADNNLYVVGSKKILPEGVKDEDDRSTLNTDALFIKYDMDGNIVFEKTYGGSSYERYNSIAFYHNNFYIVGNTCSKDAGVKVITDKKDEMTGFIIRYDINGNILKKDALGGSNNDNLVDIVTDGISFYAIGYSNSKDGNITTGRSNGKDYHGRIIKLNNKFQKLFVK